MDEVVQPPDFTDKTVTLKVQQHGCDKVKKKNPRLQDLSPEPHILQRLVLISQQYQFSKDINLINYI